MILNAPISGDVRILAQTLSFRPDAVVSGTLTYSTEEKLSVPERVVFERFLGGDVWDEMVGKMPVLPTLASILFGFIVSLLFFVVLGALMLGLKRVDGAAWLVLQTKRTAPAADHDMPCA